MKYSDWFSSSSWNWLPQNNQNYDWEKLKMQGTVTETTEEKNGFKTTTRTYVSMDGTVTITSSETIPLFDDTKTRLIEIENKIRDAVKKENYERAAELKKEKDNLLKPKNKK